ncbi:3'-5' RNA helicase YTHDC2 [Coccomyxa sp. Obi]|nr:3'-5' RNA helicase YTHDC2 [Coccomyxa sp. Obi]
MAGPGRSRGRGRGRFGISPGLRPVSEQSRLSIAEQLEEFQRSDETSYRFPPGLNNHDRAVVHAECRKYGFTSKSQGKGDSRQVTVSKPAASGQLAKDTFDLPVSPASLEVLQAYYERHLPKEEELTAIQQGGGVTSLGAADHQVHQQLGGRKRGTTTGAAHFSEQEVRRQHAAWQKAQQAPAVTAITSTRNSLPIAPYRSDILQAIASHQVVLVAGETGCGKTTQVPQFLLEDAWAAGRGCRIMCTQPRRISAISIAERVAAERGERCGTTVGYTIRLESKGGPASSLMFCTNGVLLRMLTQGEGLNDITHVIVDEIHERDRFADFLLILLRDLLPAHPNLRVVLMSATLHIELFSNYFGGCPVIEVPGFTHPVTDMYLEDVLRLIGYQDALLGQHNGGPGRRGPPGIQQPAPGKAAADIPKEQREAIESAIMQAFLHGSDEHFDFLLEMTGANSMDEADASGCVNVVHSSTGATALMAAAGKGRLADVAALLTAGADPLLRSRDGSSAQDWATKFGHADIAEFLGSHMEAAQASGHVEVSALAVSQYQASTDADEVDLALIEALLMYICGEGPYRRAEEQDAALGAVLIFLPGWDEIIRLKEQLENKQSALSGSKYSILPLHSMVPAAEQRKVFKRPPVGVRKIVLATNIAETAVTIDDIVCVINSGRHKEKSYDPYTNVSTLQATWISKASERQRRGRAGRCQQGVCFHLYSRVRSEGLADFQLPELQRSPLDELSLQVKLLESSGFNNTSIAEFLDKAVEPPPAVSVANAVRLLQDIGALEAPGERLTVLGRHLAALPLPPRIGKMLLYGVLFGCLDPILTISCCMAYRDPWVLPIEANARRAATAAKQALSDGAGGCSDHLALVRAYNAWTAERARGREYAYAAATFVSNGTMSMIDGMRMQLLGELTARGFVSSLEAASQNARDVGLVRSVMAAGFYPLVGRLLSKKLGKGQPPRKSAHILTAKEDKVKIHQSSVNCQLDAPQVPKGDPRPCPIMIFEEVTRTESVLAVRQCTAVNPHVLPLVAAELRLAQQLDSDSDSDDDRANGLPAGPAWDEEDEEGTGETTQVEVDGWLSLRVPTAALAPMLCLRQRLGACFAAKVTDPRGVLDESHAEALQTAATLFSLEAGGPENGASLDAMPMMQSFRGRGSFAPSHRGGGRSERGAEHQYGRGGRMHRADMRPRSVMLAGRGGRGRSQPDHQPHAAPVAFAPSDPFYDAPQLSHSPGGRGQGRGQRGGRQRGKGRHRGKGP